MTEELLRPVTFFSFEGSSPGVVWRQSTHVEGAQHRDFVSARPEVKTTWLHIGCVEFPALFKAPGSSPGHISTICRGNPADRRSVFPLPPSLLFKYIKLFFLIQSTIKEIKPQIYVKFPNKAFSSFKMRNLSLLP